MPEPTNRKSISFFAGVKQELFKLHQLLKTEETVIEEVVRARVGNLHDIIHNAQLRIAGIDAEILRKIQAGLTAGSDELRAVTLALQHVDEYRSIAAKHSAEAEAARKQDNAKAAKEALAAPVPPAAVAVEPPAAPPAVEAPPAPVPA